MDYASISILTRDESRVEGTEHEEHHTEEEQVDVVLCVGRILTDFVEYRAYEERDDYVHRQTCKRENLR